MIKCELCRTRYIEYRCTFCRRYVCKEHYDVKRGRCIACNESSCDICFNYLSISYCIVCRRKVCAMCSIDIDGVRRICVYCIIRSPYKLDLYFR